METVALSFNEAELMRLEAIILDKDKEEPLRFVLEVVKPKIRAKGRRSLDVKRGGPAYVDKHGPSRRAEAASAISTAR